MRKPIYLHGEIIQIGAVKLDADFQVADTFKIMISPKYYRKMNGVVARLTRISNADLSCGFPFEQAICQFIDWCGEDFVLLTWGFDDIPMLCDNIRMHKLRSEWIPEWYNVQILYDDQIAKERRQHSLQSALEKTNETGYQAHDALHDAMNTVRVCCHLDMAKGLAEYAAHFGMIGSTNTGPQAACLRRDAMPVTYATRQAALADDDVRRFDCPICGEHTDCTAWISQNSDKKMALATCPNGEALFVRLKMAKTTDGRVRASRMIYLLDEQNRAYYRKRISERHARGSGLVDVDAPGEQEGF